MSNCKQEHAADDLTEALTRALRREAEALLHALLAAEQQYRDRGI